MNVWILTNGLEFNVYDDELLAQCCRDAVEGWLSHIGDLTAPEWRIVPATVESMTETSPHDAVKPDDARRLPSAMSDRSAEGLRSTPTGDPLPPPPHSIQDRTMYE